MSAPTPAEVDTPEFGPTDIDHSEPLRDQWTSESRTYETSDDHVMATEMFSEPVNIRDNEGEWVSADARLVETTENLFETRRTAVDVAIAADPSATDLVSLGLGPDGSVSFGLNGATGDEVSISDVVDNRDPLPQPQGPYSSTQARGYPSDTISYEEIRPGVDVDLTTERDGVKETLILDGPAATRDFSFDLDLDGLTASISDLGEVEFRDAVGVVHAVIPVGFMEDSATDGSGMGEVTYELTGDPTAPTLRLLLDDEWLDDAARVWPIRVDPSIYQPTSDGDDTFVLQNWPANWSNHPELRTGTDTAGAYTYRSFMHFNVNPLQGKVISDAALTLWGTYSPSCTARRQNVYRVTQTWTGSTLTQWSNQPLAVEVAHTTVPGLGQPGCNQNGAFVSLGGLTATVRKWVSGAWANNGLSLRAHDEANNSFHRRFTSSSATVGSLPPRLSVLWQEPGQTDQQLADTVADSIDPTCAAVPEDDPLSVITLDGDGAATAVGSYDEVTAMPADAEADLELPGLSGGAELTLPAVGPAAEASVHGGLVVYNAAVGASDLVVQPVDGGARAIVVLPNSAAPTTYQFGLNLPASAVVEPAANGGTTIVSHDVTVADEYIAQTNARALASSPDPDPNEPVPPEDTPASVRQSVVDDLNAQVADSAITAAERDSLIATYDASGAALDSASSLEAQVDALATFTDAMSAANGAPTIPDDLLRHWLAPPAETPGGTSTPSSLRLSVAAAGVPIGEVEPAWAVDANCVHLPVEQTVTATGVSLSIDTTGAAFPVVADPNYHSLVCKDFNDHWAAGRYMRKTGPLGKKCPRAWLGFAQWSDATGRDYYPRQGRIAVDDISWWALRPNGDVCSHSPDTGGVWNFIVPCNMHDYCWDLYRYGLPRITLDTCNDLFNESMDFYCDHRYDSVFEILQREACFAVSDGYTEAVRRVAASSHRPTRSTAPTAWP